MATSEGGFGKNRGIKGKERCGDRQHGGRPGCGLWEKREPNRAF